MLEEVVRLETIRLFPESVRYFNELRGARIFVTGCSGVFGLWLLEFLERANIELDAGISIGVLTRDTRVFRARYPHLGAFRSLVVIEGDITSFALGPFRPTHLIHAATTSAHETFRGAQPLQKFETLVSGTQHVFSQISRGSVASALFLSSGAVYGPLPPDETHLKEGYAVAPLPQDVSAALGHAKRAAEFLCHAHADSLRLRLRVARCFSFAGAGLPLDLHYAVGDFVRQALSKATIEIRGDGKALRSFLHLGDLAVWLIALLADPNRSKPNVVNVGSPMALSIRQLADLVAHAVRPAPSVVVRGEGDYAIGNPVRSSYVPSIEAARQFGLDAWTSLEASIETMLISAPPRSG